MQPTYTYAQTSRATTVIQQSFSWMFGGLLVTAISAMAAASDPNLRQLLMTSPFLLIGLMLAELGLVFFIAAGIQRMSHTTAVVSFLAYSTLNGVTMSWIFWMYAGTTITAAFLSTSLIFGVMALYGLVTKKDLSGIGSIAMMGLFGIIIASFVNMLFGSSQMSYLLSYLTILVFCGLTAYDTQKIKAMSAQMDGGNLGIFGALTLYLDFINIFLALLRIFGNGRRD